MPDLPTGTITLLFTDIEGSTRLLQRLGDGYADVLDAHHRALRAAVAAHGGLEVDTQGDAFFVCFPRAVDAVAAAVAAQRALAAQSWPEGAAVHVRMGLHTGEPRLAGGRYVGLDVHRGARVCAAGHGGQVLLTQPTRDLVEQALPEGVAVRDLGAHRLKDLERPEHLYQLVIPGLSDEFPSLKTLDGDQATRPASATQLLRAAPLAGRAREQAQLHECLAAALDGRGGVALIGGEAGIGKTALAETLGAEAAARGAQVLIGRCYDRTETPPYGPWVELLEPAPPAPDHPVPAIAAIARTGGGGLADGATDVGGQATLFAEVRDYFAALAASRPLALLLDDLHWADPASLELLRALARQVVAHPILLLITYRDDELTRRHPLYHLLPGLVREAQAVRVEVRRLDVEGVRALIRLRYRLAEADEGRLVAYLHEHAEGNPFFSGELLRTLEEEGLLRPLTDSWSLGELGPLRVPALLRQVIDGRTARLGEEARRLLAVAAVIGQEAPLDLWAAVGGVEEEALLAVVEEAAEARLVEESADGLRVRFVHALIREALYDGLSPSRRRLQHRAVGEALAGAPTPDPDTVAYHFQQAGDPRAATWLIRAGQRAQRAYALLTAAERFEAALSVLESQGADRQERAGLLYRLARMRRYADPRQALALLDDALQLAQEAGDALLGAYVACARGYLRCTGMAEVRRGLAELEAGMAEFDALPPGERGRLAALQEALGDPPDEHHYRGALASWLALAGRYAEAQAQAERVLAATPDPSAVRGAGTSFYANACRGLASAHAALGRPVEAREAYARARDAYRAVEHHYQVGNTLAIELYEVVLPYRTDDLAERRRLAAEAEAAWTRASGALADLPPHLAHLPLLLMEGGWTEARELALAVRGPGSRTQWRPFATSQLAQLARGLGEDDLAWSLIREQLPEGAATEPGGRIFLDTLMLQRLAAALALDAGDLGTARAWLEAHDRGVAWSGATLGRAEGELGWAAYHRAVGDLGEAEARALRALLAARAPRQPLALLVAHRFLGEVATALGRLEDAAAHLDAALDLTEACAAVYERALTLAALAAQREATGRVDEARALLAEAREICAALGARPLLARLDALAEGRAGTPEEGGVAPIGLAGEPAPE